jgi:hypothetical protein
VKLTETCRCGCSITVEAEGDTSATFIRKRVDYWQTNHRCLVQADGPDDKSTGVGFAASQVSPALPKAYYGGISLDVRA